jgi:predicted alpha/beta hydrolase family esterase
MHNMIHGELDDRAGAPVVLCVPGLHGSGPDHWQSIWERERGDCQRVELGLWDAPRRNPWVTKIDHAIAAARPPVILVAHGLGCLAVAWWAVLSGQPLGGPVAGALLVAPPDVEGYGSALADFGPTPRANLPFPSLLVASRSDPYAPYQRARDMAAFWGSALVDAGEAGHLDDKSGIGAWSDGQHLLETLIDHVTAGGPLINIDRGCAIRRQATLHPDQAILHSLLYQ